jgi:hypothetical protein
MKRWYKISVPSCEFVISSDIPFYFLTLSDSAIDRSRDLFVYHGEPVYLVDWDRLFVVPSFTKSDGQLFQHDRKQKPLTGITRLEKNSWVGAMIASASPPFIAEAIGNEVMFRGNNWPIASLAPAVSSLQSANLR